MQHTPGQKDWWEERQILKTIRSHVTSMVLGQLGKKVCAISEKQALTGILQW